MRRPLLQSLVLALACAVSSAALCEPLKIRIGYSDAAMHLTPVLFTKPGILKHYGKSYVVEVLAFQGGAPQLTAIAANQLDIAAVAFTLLPLAVKRANLDVRVVADTVQSSVPGYADLLFMAKKGRFKSPADLKGATIALNALGSGIDAANREFLERAGLKLDRDYRFVEVRFSGMLPALNRPRGRGTIRAAL
jgi:sulfonate transport system substrate-binding protein